MKKTILILLLLPAMMLQQSCIVMVKSLARNIVKGYDDYADKSVSGAMLLGTDNKPVRLKDAFMGKTVYAVVYKSTLNNPSAGDSTAYEQMKARFKAYPDVRFVSVYNGEDETYWRNFSNGKTRRSDAYRLSNGEEQPWKGLGDTPQALIIGTDGKVLAYKAPMPNSKVLADYVLFQARAGRNGTESARDVIKEINEGGKFKSDHMKAWYTSHFKLPAEQASLSFSNSNE
ncbi:hypothetical protein [Pedobacter yulinensis]|nr:hypothetical protein [Pedobacter yulinensis]